MSIGGYWRRPPVECKKNSVENLVVVQMANNRFQSDPRCLRVSLLVLTPVVLQGSRGSFLARIGWLAIPSVVGRKWEALLIQMQNVSSFSQRRSQLWTTVSACNMVAMYSTASFHELVPKNAIQAFSYLILVKVPYTCKSTVCKFIHIALRYLYCNDSTSCILLLLCACNVYIPKQ